VAHAATAAIKRAQTTESLILFSWFCVWAGLGYGSGAKRIGLHFAGDDNDVGVVLRKGVG